MFGGKGINVMEKKGTPPNKDLAMSQPLYFINIMQNQKITKNLQLFC